MGDVKHTCEIAGKESRQCRISESAWSNDSEIPQTRWNVELRKTGTEPTPNPGSCFPDFHILGLGRVAAVHGKLFQFHHGAGDRCRRAAVVRCRWRPGYPGHPRHGREQQRRHHPVGPGLRPVDLERWWPAATGHHRSVTARWADQAARSARAFRNRSASNRPHPLPQPTGTSRFTRSHREAHW